MKYFLAKSTKRGFTLIELLVVIAIIGILASVVLASLSDSRRAARDASRMATAKQLQTALELYRNNTGGYPCASSTNPNCTSTTNNAADSISVERRALGNFSATEIAVLNAINFDPVVSPAAPADGTIQFRLRYTGVATNRGDRTSYTIIVRHENKVFPTTSSATNPYCSINVGPGHSSWNGATAGSNFPPCF